MSQSLNQATAGTPARPLSASHSRAVIDGRECFVKHWADAPTGFFAAEANGLRWLADTHTVAIPDLVGHDESSIAVALIGHGPPSATGAESFGRALASLHQCGADSFGAPWPGFIGPLPMDNHPEDDWATFFARRRIEPLVAQAQATGSLDAAGARAISDLLGRLDVIGGPAEPPSRLHGDLWSGNLVIDPDATFWVIDPAAHGGHRESDLAMLALFGAPQLERILAAYHEHTPLADDWRERVGLHQLHPLLVHAVLFGASYGARAAEVASRYR